MEKLMFVVTTQFGTTMCIAKSAVAVVIPEKQGCKIITNLICSPYDGRVENMSYHVQESTQEVINMINSNN